MNDPRAPTHRAEPAAAGATCHHRDRCRICGSAALLPYLDLGPQPPSNSFLPLEDVAAEQRFPLRVYLCQDCGLSQLIDVVSASAIFDEYAYLSSSSHALRLHYQGMVDAVLAAFQPAEGSLVVDVGCNDGITLKCYPPGRFRLLGVEPSTAGRYAEEAGFEVVKAFFDRDVGRALAEEHGPASLITATNVFAHVDDIHSFAAGIRGALAPAGVCVLEFPYVVDMVEGRFFDTIYHEHLCYLGLTPVRRLLAEEGLRLFRVERVSFGASGPALRVFACRDDGPYPTEPSVDRMIAAEERWGLRRPDRYRDFADAVSAIRTDLRSMIEHLRSQGHRVGAFTAPAKGNTLLNYLGATPRDIVAVSENNPLKIGKVTPGTRLPIVTDEEFLRLGVSHALLLSWNYAEFFLKHAEFVRRGGKFIVPLPKPSVQP